MADYNDSHLSQGGAKQPAGPTRQHHQLACGKHLNGEKTPYTAPNDTAKRVGNAPKTY